MQKDFSHIAKVTIDLRNQKGDPFQCDIRYINKINFSFYDKNPCVLICPGFMAYKNWGPYEYYGNRFAEAGFVSIVMNYSHSGIKDDITKITDYENFATNTVSQELLDIQNVIDNITNGVFSEFNIDKDKLIGLGHSRGAANLIITTSRDRRIKTLVTWAAIAYYDRWTDHQKKEWRQLGYLRRIKDFEANPLRMDVSFLDDLEANKSNFNLVDAAKKINVPWLIVHGQEDLLAKISEAATLYKASDKSKTKYVSLEKLGHLLGVEVPFDENNKAINDVIDLTINWLQKNI
jgi:uncharacterized protein